MASERISERTPLITPSFRFILYNALLNVRILRATNLHDVFDIVNAHGGTIQAQENQGGGTVFVIEFPLEGEEGVEEAVLMDDENG